MVITKEWCKNNDSNFIKVEYNGFSALISPTGRVKIWNKTNYVEKEWRYNADGYPVITLTDGKRYRSIAIHILVACAFVPNVYNKPEVNHLDFNRANPCAYNLEWVTHKENIAYSYKAGRYKGKFGKENPNYGNNKLHMRYLADKDFAKEKQSRPGGKNGKAKPCSLFHQTKGLIATFEYQREAVYYLVEIDIVEKGKNPETIIKRLRSEKGYKDYYLRLV